jgi:hypothetical protein
MRNPFGNRDRDEAVVHIYESEVNAIIAEAQRFPSSETGGDLYGTFTHGYLPVIWLASGPGPKAKHLETHFEQDVAFISHWQQRLMKDFGLQYIGSWHSHHTLGLNQPSDGDVQAARNYAVRHGRPRTLEIIVNHEGRNQITKLRPYYYPNAQESGWVPTRFNILTRESPLRATLGPDEASFSSGVDWRQINSSMRRNLSESQSTSSQAHVPYSDGPTTDYPPELVEAIQILAIEDVEIEQRGNLFMVVVPIDDNKKIAFALQDSQGLRISQVNFIDRSQGINTNINEQLSHRGFSLVINRHNAGVLRDISHFTLELFSGRQE